MSDAGKEKAISGVAREGLIRFLKVKKKKNSLCVFILTTFFAFLFARR